MIIIVTRNGKSVGFSSVIGSIDTRIMTEAANAALQDDLEKLAATKAIGVDEYIISISNGDGVFRNISVNHDPQDPWATPVKRILNEIGMTRRI